MSETTSDIDSLIAELGGCGLFQNLVVCAAILTCLSSVWGMMLMAFGSYNPGWRCADHEMPWNISVNSSTTVADSITNDMHVTPRSGTVSVTGQDYPASNGDLGNRTQNATHDVCNVWKSCQNVVFSSESSTVVTEWNLICDRSWIPPMMVTLQMAGVLAGAYVTGHLGDRMGRKFCLFGNVAFHAVVNFVTIFSLNWEMFLVLRVLIGFAVGGILTSGYVYAAEFLTHQWRGILGAVPIWNIGMMTFAVAVYLLRDWRSLHIATCIVSVLTFLPAIWIPESMRWLAVNDRVKAAKNVATRIARVNKRPVPNTNILDKIAREEKELYEAGLIRKPTYLDLFKQASVRKSSVILGVVWICMAIIYYGISFGIKSFSGDFYINFIIFSVTELPGMLFVAPTANIIGRRWGSAIHMFISALACLAVVPVIFLVQEGETKDLAVNALALVAKMVIVSAWAVVTVLGTESFPTVVRNLSFGYLGAMSRIGAMIGPYIVPDDSDSLYLSFLVMGLILMMCTGLLLLLRETKGRPLRDVIETKTGFVKLSTLDPDSNIN